MMVGAMRVHNTYKLIKASANATSQDVKMSFIDSLLIRSWYTNLITIVIVDWQIYVLLVGNLLLIKQMKDASRPN